ncbi:MAG: hypothetical protein BSOLF_2463 [Candidatus Carbobacillus altaicus]|uniref:Uncharacterized protein n=1 Tax=Candidatus Carbonibacillus altaicus TaxID=2163959 RepID=A0A2R6XY27_9BACL|nr:MAG: hypothetical protein BSOLF_2463 [Candidatus Carbobacillus altaicus]
MVDWKKLNGRKKDLYFYKMGGDVVDIIGASYGADCGNFTRSA